MQVFNIPIDEEQKETTIHGSFDFPLAVYDSVMSRNVLGYINWHWHEELQSCLVTLGTIDFFCRPQTISSEYGRRHLC